MNPTNKTQRKDPGTFYLSFFTGARGPFISQP